MSLPEPAAYTPWIKGKYDVAPSLKALGSDFGNPAHDRLWFQFDTRCEEFLHSKARALEENFGKYVHRADLKPEVESCALRVMGRQLAAEYPNRFELGANGLFDVLKSVVIETLDALALSVQEDICLVTVEDGRDWISYLHVCSPSHWLPSEKIGRPFFDVHTVVPGFETVNKFASSLVEAMVRKGPFVRFVWGVESDTRPNHHPEPPPGEDPVVWDGRDFSNGRFWVRSERQVIWGLPEVDSAIFTIKVNHVPDHVVLTDPELRSSLVRALESMSPESRDYKGLIRGWDELMGLLQGQ